MRVGEVAHPVGLVRIAICDADGRVVEEREHPNLICNAGISQIAAAVVWSAARDQNTNMGSPLTTQNLYPIYGAVGSSSTAATANDTTLGSETGRAVVSEVSYSGAMALLTFFFPTTATSWTITECGVFVSGSSTATSSANTGLLLNHAVFGAVTKTAAQTMTFQASFTF